MDWIKKIINFCFIVVLSVVFIGCKEDDKIDLDLTGLQLVVGDSYKFELNQEVRYIVSNENIVSITDNVITGLASGEVTVTIVLINNDEITKDIVVTVSAASHTITYDLDGGVCDNLINSFKRGENVTLPTPTKAGCVFIGWYEGTTLIENITKGDRDYNLKAVWENGNYTITYDLDGGVCENLINSFKYGDSITLPTPTKEGFEFVGWYEGETKVETITNGNKNYNLKASWELMKFTIAFYDDNNNLYESKEYNYNEQIVSPTPTKENTDEYDYSFVSWDKEFSVATSDMEIHAIFEAQRFYKVDFYQGDVLLESQRVIDGGRPEDIDFSSSSDSKLVFYADSYYSDKDYTTRYNIRQRIIEDTTVYVRVKFKPVDANLEGKKISILGDSISSFYQEGSAVNSYYTEVGQFYYPIYSSSVKSYEQTWWWKTISSTKTVLGINNSWSGSSCHNDGSETNGGAMNYIRINTLGEKGTPDIILVNIGTNDNVNGKSKADFEAAYNTMLGRITEKYPNAIVFCFTLGYSAYTGYLYTEAKRLEYNEVIRSLCTKYKAVVLEIDKVQTIETYDNYLGDFLHPNADGMTAISEYVSGVIKELYSSGIYVN